MDLYDIFVSGDFRGKGKEEKSSKNNYKSILLLQLKKA